MRLASELTALKTKPETAWLKDADSQALQQVLNDLDQAFVNFFEKRARFPRFKSKRRDQARFRIPQRVKLADGKVYVPKIGWVKVRQTRDVAETTKSRHVPVCGQRQVVRVAGCRVRDARYGVADA